MDTWVFSEKDCANPIVPANPTQSLGQAVCMIVQQWSQAQVEARYEPYLDCTYQSQGGQTVPQIIISDQQALASFVISATTMGTQLTASLQQIATSMSAAGATSKALLAKTNTYFQTISTPVTEAVGLSAGLNCAFLTADYDHAQTSVCKNVLPSLFVLMLLTSIASLICLVSLVPVLLMARRSPKAAKAVVSNSPA